MSHGSVAGVLSLGGKIPANSNSVFTSRQSPFRAPAIARSAFCNSRCWVAEGREEEAHWKRARVELRARALSAAAQEASALHKILSRTRASAPREFLWRTRARRAGAVPAAAQGALPLDRILSRTRASALGESLWRTRARRAGTVPAAAQEALPLHRILSRTRASALREHLSRARARRARAVPAAAQEALPLHRILWRTRASAPHRAPSWARARRAGTVPAAAQEALPLHRILSRTRASAYIGLLRGRGLGGRGRPPHIPHIGKVGGGPGLIADDAFGDAE